MQTSYDKKLEEAKDITEIFNIVKELVRKFLGRERNGLTLGLAELGGMPGQFVGAFHPIGSNLIVLNKTPLRVIEATKSKFLFKAYLFHLLLYEYIHTIGILDERATRIVTHKICESAFGSGHPVAIISRDFSSVFPEVILASINWVPKNFEKIEIVQDLDKENLNYFG
ncbi:MAG: hypothetical protein QXQ18_00535 [Candidatus Aenigmatarchaeota archaeon]